MLGRQVTAYHAHPFKITTSQAHFYEIRSGNDIVVRYQEIIDHIQYDVSHRRERAINNAIFLTMLFVFPLIEALLQYRRNKHQPKFTG